MIRYLKGDSLLLWNILQFEVDVAYKLVSVILYYYGTFFRLNTVNSSDGFLGFSYPPKGEFFAL